MARWDHNKSESEHKPRRSEKWSMTEKREYRMEKEDKAYDRFADMLISKLESFKGDWKKPWYEDVLAPPKALYGKQYSGMNALMLSMLCEQKGYKIPVFATSLRISDMNFVKDADGKKVPAVDKDSGERLPLVHILKGEEAFPVFLSQVRVVNKDTKDVISYPEYVKLSPAEQENYDVRHLSRVYPVFNIDQTNLKEARPELYQKLADENLPKKIEHSSEMFSFAPVDHMIENNLWLCPIEHKNGEGAYFSPGRDIINMPEKETFTSGQEYYGTLFHEMTHSTGPEGRLNRDSEVHYHESLEKRATEELVAELGAVTMCQRYGISKIWKDEVTENSFAYLNSWLKVLREDPKFIKTILNDVKQATGVITVCVEESREQLLKNDDSLDLRDTADSEVTVDVDGNEVTLDGNDYAPDKKQGSGEGQKADVPEAEQRHSWRSR